MEFGMAHSSRLQHNNTCNLINPLEAGRGTSDRHGLLSTASGGRLMNGAGAAHTGEEFVGAGDVGGDLRAQLFGTVEFFFFAKALPEANFHALGCRAQLSVEQMRFNAERRAVERGTEANIGHRAVTASLSFKARTCDVDAPGGKQFLLDCKVQRGKCEFPPRSRAADDFSRESKGPPQKTGGVGHVTFGDFPANDGAGDHFPSIDDGRNNHDVEAVLRAKLGEQFHVAGLLVPESKIFTDQNSLYMQIADKNLFDKFVRREPREIEREG